MTNGGWSGRLSMFVLASLACTSVKTNPTPAERLQTLTEKIASGEVARGHAAGADIRDLCERAELYEERGDHDKAEVDLDRAEQESAAWDTYEKEHGYRPGGWQRMSRIMTIRRTIYRGFIARTQGTPEEARYKEQAAQLDQKWLREESLGNVRDRAQAHAAAAERADREAQRADQLRKDIARGKSEQANLAVVRHQEAREQAERAKSIAKYGACDGCNGTGKITWQAPSSGNYQPTKSGILWGAGELSRTQNCRRCGGTGFKGSDYEFGRDP